MNGVNNISDSVFSGAGMGIPSGSEAGYGNLGQEQFLKLMVTQLKYQDPLSPKENGEFLGQLAQFSTVRGINDLQESFNMLASVLASNQTLQAANLAGNTVLVPADSIEIGEAESVSGAVEPQAGTTSVTVKILEQSGQMIRSLKLDPSEGGMVRFEWDGLDDQGNPVTPGTYKIIAEMEIDGKNQPVETLISAKVESIILDHATMGILLNLAGLGPMDILQVREIGSKESES
ncbi:MAG: flagellar hook assembly protein FlgD [Thermodesulfobacteriota bacterium]|nr:flagellar hook assembly protein FlgD [Thermodesulfobacteriota bacterium]